MNCKQANENISIREILESFSLFPSKENSRTAFYFALDREEKTPSLSVDFIKNTAFDFGTGKSYDIISIVQTMKRCSVSDALKYLEQFNFSFQKQNLKLENLPKGYEIIEKRFKKELFTSDFMNRIEELQLDLKTHRNQNFLGQILQHQSLQSTKYMSKWIEAKNS